MITAIQNTNNDAGSWRGRQQGESDIYNRQYVKRLEKEDSKPSYKLIESFSVSFSSAIEELRLNASATSSALPFII